MNKDTVVTTILKTNWRFWKENVRRKFTFKWKQNVFFLPATAPITEGKKIEKADSVNN